MTTDQLHNYIRTRVAAYVTGVRLQYDNGPVIAAVGDNANDISVNVTIREGESIQVASGITNRYRTPGVVFLQIFCPVNIGDSPVLALADIIVSAFRGVSADGVTYRVPSVVPVGRNNDRWQVNVNVPFYVDTLA